MKTRLDLLLVEQGLAESRTKAQALIMAGLVYRGEQKLDKAGLELPDDAELTVRGKEHPWVSRGGIKLAHALTHFAIDVTGVIALDVGSSTGGFTDVLLTQGARKVYAVDVGTGQLDSKLRTDPRVVVMEQTNARDLTWAMLHAAETSYKPHPAQARTNPPSADALTNPPSADALTNPPPASGGSRRGEHAPLGTTAISTRQRTAMNPVETLRKNPTDAEKKLWSFLRANQLNNIKFRRQQSIGPYIVDFVSMEHHLVIELDGGQHNQPDAIANDEARNAFLAHAGYRVVRYWNHEVMANPEGVMRDIASQLARHGVLPPPGLPPQAGGGEVNFIVCDASFISMKKVLAAPLALAATPAQLVTLIKPQFEVGKAEVSRGKGVIRDPILHQQVCDDIAAWVVSLGWAVRGITASPITGPKGNVEFLLYAVKGNA